MIYAEAVNLMSLGLSVTVAWISAILVGVVLGLLAYNSIEKENERDKNDE